MNKLIARTIFVSQKRTSIKLDNHTWEALKEISERENLTVNQVCTNIYYNKENSITLTHAIKTFIFLYFRAAVTEEGHIKAGHGIKKEIRNPAINAKEKIWYDDFKK